MFYTRIAHVLKIMLLCMCFFSRVYSHFSRKVNLFRVNNPGVNFQLGSS